MVFQDPHELPLDLPVLFLFGFQNNRYANQTNVTNPRSNYFERSRQRVFQRTVQEQAAYYECLEVAGGAGVGPSFAGEQLGQLGLLGGMPTMDPYVCIRIYAEVVSCITSDDIMIFHVLALYSFALYHIPF